MWQPCEDSHRGLLHFERFVSCFVAPVLEGWKDLETSHSLSVVFFTRTRIEDHERHGDDNHTHDPLRNAHGHAHDGHETGGGGGGGGGGGQKKQPGGKMGIIRDAEGRLYRDYYKMVIENEAGTDIRSLPESSRAKLNIGKYNTCLKLKQVMLQV